MPVVHFPAVRMEGLLKASDWNHRSVDGNR